MPLKTLRSGACRLAAALRRRGRPRPLRRELVQAVLARAAARRRPSRPPWRWPRSPHLAAVAFAFATTATASTARRRRRRVDARARRYGAPPRRSETAAPPLSEPLSVLYVPRTRNASGAAERVARGRRARPPAAAAARGGRGAAAAARDRCRAAAGVPDVPPRVLGHPRRQRPARLRRANLGGAAVRRPPAAENRVGARDQRRRPRGPRRGERNRRRPEHEVGRRGRARAARPLGPRADAGIARGRHVVRAGRRQRLAAARPHRVDALRARYPWFGAPGGRRLCAARRAAPLPGTAARSARILLAATPRRAAA